MAIESYAFGSMVVDGRSYARDLVLLPEGVRPDWWREDGHSVAPSDLAEVLAARPEVLAARPEVLVVGTGAFGAMDVPGATREALRRAGIALVVEPTGEAARRYNALAAEGRRVAGAFHLTC